jgi:hypothetical protein
MGDSSPQFSPTYLQLRERMLSLKPADLGLSPSEAAPHVWGVLVEMGYDVGSATLVVLADGTTSLHYSTGGGLLGRGDYAPLAQASKALVTAAQPLVEQMEPARDFNLPAAGQVRFILLGYDGVYETSTSEKSLASGKHPMASVFQLVHEILGQLHQLAKKKRK